MKMLLITVLLFLAFFHGSKGHNTPKTGLRLQDLHYIEPEELIHLISTSPETLAIIDARDNDYKVKICFSNYINSLVVKHKQKLLDTLIQEKKTVVVFHCQFSIYRGPSWARSFIEFMKQLNIHLHKIKVLKGGIDGFATHIQENPEYSHILEPISK